MFEVGWINDKAGPLTGQETGDSELIDADGNTISTLCAAPANMRLSSPELSLTQQQEAIQIVSGASSCDQQNTTGQVRQQGRLPARQEEPQAGARVRLRRQRAEVAGSGTACFGDDQQR